MHPHSSLTLTARRLNPCPPSFRRAFTLIEMLVVIAIIGILASLIVGLAGRSSEQKIRKRAESENAALAMAIQVYKEKLGYFPQDGYQGPNQPPNYSPLYYELTKTQIPNNSGPQFGNIKGIGNTGTKSEAVLTEVKGGQYRDENGIRYLTFAYGNVPWKYNATSPTNNPDSFDLWVEVEIAGKKTIIGNWKD